MLSLMARTVFGKIVKNPSPMLLKTPTLFAQNALDISQKREYTASRIMGYTLSWVFLILQKRQGRSMETVKKSRRTRRVIILVAVVAAVVLLLRYLPLNYALPDEEDFALTASELPDTLRVGDTLTVEATLKGPWDRSFLASRGVNLVYIEIFTPEEQEKTYDDIGLWDYLPAGVSQHESRSVTVQSPGEYTVRIYASFSIGEQEYRCRIPDKTVTVAA